MFYLTTHSTHFNTVKYGVGHVVKDHSDSKRGNPRPPNHQDNGRPNCVYPTDRIAHVAAFDTPVVDHWLERAITQWVSIRRPFVPRANALTTKLHLADSTKVSYVMKVQRKRYIKPGWGRGNLSPCCQVE